MKTRYRIVIGGCNYYDDINGNTYKIQYKKWFVPFWFTCGFGSLEQIYYSIEEAEKHIGYKRNVGKVVKEVK